VKTDNSVWCWGFNDQAQLGRDPATTPKTATALQVTGVGNTIAVVGAGQEHTCAIVVSPVNTLRCWGWNTSGQLGADPQTTPRSIAPVVVPNLANVTAVSGGDAHSCAVAGGAAYCWGYNGYGQLGNNDSTLTNSFAPVGVVGLASGVAVVDAGGYHSCARKSDGSVLCWGKNGTGQIGNGMFLGFGGVLLPYTVMASGAFDVTAGESHTCAPRTDGMHVCWGRGTEGQIGNGATMSQPSPVGILLTCP
jgi:alpha-tubulin suppressor-like RCC1 family protein